MTIDDYDFIAGDTETGGLDSSTDALLSVALVTSWETEPLLVHIQPQGRLTAKAIEVNGYSRREWERRGAMSEKHAAMTIQHWFNQLGRRGLTTMAAHNAGFDCLFLSALEARTGIDLGLPKIWQCTQIKLRELRSDGILPEGNNHLDDLGSLCGFWEKARRCTEHDALQDARCVVSGLRWIQEKRKGAAVA